MGPNETTVYGLVEKVPGDNPEHFMVSDDIGLDGLAEALKRLEGKKVYVIVGEDY